MGLEYITVEELPRLLKCRECGSARVKVYGSRTVEFERIEVNGEREDEETYVDSEIIYGVECLDCHLYAEPDEIKDLFG
jgi:hypothetical protein